MARKNETVSSTTPATELTIANPTTDLAPAERLQSTMLAVFNPSACNTLADREALIALAVGTQNGLNLASYRVIYDIYQSGDWREKLDPKGAKYTNFDKYCADTFGLKHTQVDSAKRVGSLIREDGQATKLLHKTTKQDFNFTQLVALMDCLPLFECEYGEPDKNGKRKIVNKSFKMGYYMTRAYDEYGNQIWLNGNKTIYGGVILKSGSKDYVQRFDFGGDPIPCTVLEMLCDMDLITPATGAKSLKSVVEELFGKLTDIPADSEPADSEPADSEPADSEPADSEPADSEPASITIMLSPKAYELLITLTSKVIDGYEPSNELDEIIEKLGIEL